MLTAAVLLADDDTDKGSPIGILVLIVLVIAVYFLYRSMSRHVRGLPAKFDAPEPVKQDEPAAPADRDDPVIAKDDQRSD